MQGVMVSIDHRKVEHINKLLQAAPEKALTVYRRAIQRGLEAARVRASREIRERYAISEGNLRTYRNIRSSVDATTDGVAGFISFAGAKIPLYRFHPSPKDRKYTNRYVNKVAGWRITTDVSAEDAKESGMVRRSTAFIATFPSGHTGMFTRTGGKTSGGKEKLRELYGFSVADMLDYEPAREAIQARAAQVIEDRLDHELMRALEET